MIIFLIIHFLIASIGYGIAIYQQFHSPFWHRSMKQWKLEFLFDFIVWYFFWELGLSILLYQLFKSSVKKIVRSW